MGTMVHVAAALHLRAASPNFLICEFHPPLTRLGNDLLVEPLEPIDSHLTVPTGPGLGIAFDEERLAQQVVQTRRRVALPVQVAAKHARRHRLYRVWSAPEQAIPSTNNR